MGFNSLHLNHQQGASHPAPAGCLPALTQKHELLVTGTA
jgi:hypothetical protein